LKTSTDILLYEISIRHGCKINALTR